MISCGLSADNTSEYVELLEFKAMLSKLSASNADGWPCYVVPAREICRMAAEDEMLLTGTFTRDARTLVDIRALLRSYMQETREQCIDSIVRLLPP